MVPRAAETGVCRMRALGLAVVAATFTVATAVAADDRFERSLKMLAPAERLEQLCDYTAMMRIRNEAKQYRPDRAVANAMAEPKAAGDTIEVTGGAFRSRKKWVALSAGHPARQIRLPLDHLRRRHPVRPFALERNFLRTAPLETVAANTDAV